MITKKSNTKNIILNSIICLMVLITATVGFKLYHDSKYVKDEYERVCPQNYGDPISLDRCYWSYKFEGETLTKAIYTEIGALFIVPILIFVTSLI